MESNTSVVVCKTTGVKWKSRFKEVSAENGLANCPMPKGNSEIHFNVQVKGEPTVNGQATDDGTNGIEVIRNAILIFTFGVTSVLVIGCVLLLPQLLRK